MAATLMTLEGQVASTDARCLNYDLLEGQYEAGACSVQPKNHPKEEIRLAIFFILPS